MNKVQVDFPVSKGLKGRREILLWWILKVRRETGASWVLQADKDSQGEEDPMGFQGPLETLAPRVTLSVALLEKEAFQDFQGQKGY